VTVIAVLASRFDDAAAAAAAVWRATTNVVVLTVDDLVSPGWVVPTSDVANSRFVAERRIHSAHDLAGVVNLLPRVHDFELLGIRRRDRRYVSAELWAMLVWWLRSLPCPVFNRPTAGCLNGPSWQLEHWIGACRRAGIPASARGRDDGANEIRSTCVVHRRTLGRLYPAECRILSDLAKTDFLEVFFRKQHDRWSFQAVNLMPTIERADIRNLVGESSHGAAVGIAAG
jgi:hypothetical protein